jgi:hypothetical protein
MAPNTASPAGTRTLARPREIAAAGTLAGSLDILAAFTVWMTRGVLPTRVLQSVASGLLGRGAYEGGTPVALLGLALHFTIAFGAAAVYYALSRAFPLLVRRPLLCGALYGIAVYFFMDYVVIPLSRFPRGPKWNPLSLAQLSTGIPIHIVCIGLAISFMTSQRAAN